jgi:hypothetical protein
LSSDLDKLNLGGALSFITFIILNMPLIIPGIAKINAAVVKPNISDTGCCFCASSNSSPTILSICANAEKSGSGSS